MQDQLAHDIFNFDLPMVANQRETAQPVNRKQVEESRVKRAAADRRFVQANADRFRSSYIGGVSDSRKNQAQAFGLALAQQRLGNTPFLDAIRQRLLAQRAVGLRGA